MSKTIIVRKLNKALAAMNKSPTIPTEADVWTALGALEDAQAALLRVGLDAQAPADAG
jgi:hypothetical protein